MIKNKYCLVLNSFYEPVRIVNYRTAIRSLFSKEGAEVLEEYDELIHSPSISIPLPSVLRLPTKITKHHWAKNKRNFKVFKPSKFNIFTRDEGKCTYCEKELRFEDATLDHIQPKSKGGKTTWDNLTLACEGCNLKKSNKDPENFKTIAPPVSQAYHIEKSIGIKITKFKFPMEWFQFLSK